MSQWLEVKHGGGKTYIQVSHIEAISPNDTPGYSTIITDLNRYKVPHSVDSLINTVIGPGGLILIPAP
jgi:hypothetical protein